MPGSSRVRRLVLFVCVLGGSLLGALVFALTASAQTSTPTPRPTKTPMFFGTPDPTNTPVFENPDPGWGDVVWWYVLDKGAAVVGTWSDTVDVSRISTCSGVGCYVYDPPNNQYTHLVVVPPSQTRAMTVTCSGALMVFREDPSAAGVGYVDDDAQPSSLTFTKVDGDVGGVDKVLASGGAWSAWSTYRIVLGQAYAAWPGAETVPAWDDVPYGYSHWSLKVGSGTNHVQDQAGVSGRVICGVVSLERFDGSTYTPRVPVADDSDIEWVPWDDWDPIEWKDAPPTTGGFGFGDEVQGDCFTIVPGYQYTVPVPSWIGADVAMGWPSREVCVIERDLDVVLFGIDLGQMAYIWVLVSAVFYMIGVWRRG